MLDSQEIEASRVTRVRLYLKLTMKQKTEPTPKRGPVSLCHI